MTAWPEVPKGYDAVAIDLDGTLAAKTWPDPHVGELIPEGRDAVLHYYTAGYQVDVFTARPEGHFPRVWRWLEDNGLRYVIYDVTNHKEPRWGLLIDDHAWRPPWTEPNPEIADILVEMNRLMLPVLQDGARKRKVGEKPLWKVDKHVPSIHSHYRAYMDEELKDPDSGQHPLQHLMVRSGMQAWQELEGASRGRGKHGGGGK